MGYWRRETARIVAWTVALALAPGCHHTSAPARPPLVDATMLPGFDPAAQADGRPPELGPLPPLEVRDYGPEGVRDTEAIRLRFNQPLVDMRKTPAEHPPGALTLRMITATGEAGEAVPSRARWTAHDTLELTPDVPLPEATRFEASFAGGLVNREGSRVDGVAWRFETARPTVRWLEDWEPVATDMPLYVVTDQPVRAAVLTRHVRVMAIPREGTLPREVAVGVQEIERTELPPLWDDDVAAEDGSESRIFAISPKVHWPVGARARLEVDAGLHGETGPLPLAEPYAAALLFRDELRVRGLECEERRGRSCAPGWLTLRLSNAPGEGELEKIEVSPRPEGFAIRESYYYEEESEEDDDGEEADADENAADESDDADDTARYPDAAHGSAFTIEGEFEIGRSYRITVPASFTDEYGQALGRRYRKTVTIRAAAPELETGGEAALALSSNGGTFLRPEDARVGLIARHVEQARIRVGVLEPAALRSLLRAEDLGAQAWPSTATTTVSLQTLKTHGSDAYAQAALALGRLGGMGDALLVELEAEALTAMASGESRPEPVRGLFQISNIGAVVDMSPARGVVWVTKAEDGSPWAGVEAELHTASGITALPRSDANGLLALPGARALGKDVLLVLRDPTGEDRLVLPLRDYRWLSSRGRSRWSRPYRDMYWQREAEEKLDQLPKALQLGERALVGVQLGRGVHLPGDEIQVAGWAGIATPYREISTRRVKAGTPVRLELRHDGAVVATRRTAVSRHGRFTTTFTVPQDAALGAYEVWAELLESDTETSFVVADSRIPTFEIVTRALVPGVLHGQTVTLRTLAQQLSGEPAPLMQLRWNLHCWPSALAPEGYGWLWAFGPQDTGPSHESRGTVSPRAARARIQVELETAALDPKQRYRCTPSVAGQDASFQEVGAEGEGFFVHPARVYVGVRAPKRAVAGEPLAVLADAVDLHGQRVDLSGVELTIEREPEVDPRKREERPRVEVARCRLDVAAGQARPRCSVAEPLAGSYRATAIAEADGVPIAASTTFTVPEQAPEEPEAPEGPEEPEEPGGSTETLEPPPRRFELTVPDEIAAGQPARIQIDAPWDEGRGLLTVSQTGLREAIPFTLHAGQALVSVTPRAGRGPRLELQASMARPSSDTELPTIALATAWTTMLEPRALAVRIDAPASASPGREVPLRLSVRDEAGEPVDARLAVWVVDEGIHQLREPYPAQLEAIFDPDRPGDQQRTQSHDALLRPFQPWMSLRGRRVPHVRQAKATVKGSADLGLRQRFEAVPLFEGDVGTGPDGEVTLTLPLPDDVTRFRVTAIASAELDPAVGEASGPARFGRAKAEIEVSAPMIVRAALPRVLRPGDVAEVAALVTTPADRAGTVVVEASLREAEAVLALTGPTRRSLRVDGVRPARAAFDVKALGPGEPAVRLVARFVPDDGDTKAEDGPRGWPLKSGVEQRLAVEVERTQIERAAVYGRLDHGGAAAIPVRIPADARPDHGGLTIALRTTALGDLDDAARYLVEYPHGCVEQTASRLLPLVALGGLADRLPTGVDPTALATDTLHHLLSMQRPDGAFAYWPGSSEQAPYAGAYATWVMQLAAEEGLPVPPAALERAQAAVLDRLAQPLPDRSWEREDARALRALAVHTLVRAGKGHEVAVGVVLDDLFDHRDELPVFANALLLMALHGADPADPRVAVAARRLGTSIERLPGHAHVVTPEGSRYAWLFDSPARSQALTLMALLQVSPDDPVVDELARGLVQKRRDGRWRNTQENAYALLAMADYAHEREAEVPDLRVEAWLGPHKLLAAKRRGRDAGSVAASSSMAALLGPMGTDRTTHVVLDREGTGALFYRVGMEWAGSEPAPARSQGLSLRRTLIDAGAELAVGRRYAIEVEVDTDAPQHYLAIEVPLPAGLEAIDTGLGHGARARVDFAVRGRGDFISHQELRRDRVVLFADALAPGRHVHTIYVLATTPGRYALPAAVAEAMYTPEVRARTTAEKIRVVGP